MRVDRLRAGPPVAVGAMIVVPIERTMIEACPDNALGWIVADKRAHALVVHDAAGTRAIGVDSSPIALDALLARVPGLDAVLDSISDRRVARPGPQL